VRALKESWKEAPQAIEELEKEGEVLVTRTVKDGQLRMVFWNEIKPTEEGGGIPVEKGTFAGSVYFDTASLHFLEFLDLWHSLKVPNDVDLLRQLASGTQQSYSLSCHRFSDISFRGFTGHSRRDSHTQRPNDQEEGQEGWCTPPASSSHGQHTSERRSRSRQCYAGEMSGGFYSPRSYRTTDMYIFVCYSYKYSVHCRLNSKKW